MSLAYFLRAASASPLVTKEGMMHPDWANYFQQLNTYLSQNISPEGLQTPFQNTANITILNNANSLGKIIYNTDNDTALINLAGVFKTIQVM